jgi:hypothetical protein
MVQRSNPLLENVYLNKITKIKTSFIICGGEPAVCFLKNIFNGTRNFTAGILSLKLPGLLPGSRPPGGRDERRQNIDTVKTIKLISI